MEYEKRAADLRTATWPRGGPRLLGKQLGVPIGAILASKK